MTRIIQDAPPYMILEGHPSRVRGVNVIGLQRAASPNRRSSPAPGVPDHLALRRSAPRTLEDLKTRAGGSRVLAHLVESLLSTGKGAKGRYRESLRDQFQRAGVQRVLGEPATS